MTFVRVPQTEILWHPIEPTETHVLPSNKRGAWRNLAEIRLGQHEGRWFFANSFYLLTGDITGQSAPLGFWSDWPAEYRAGLPDRHTALQRAIDRMRSHMAARSKDFAGHLAWLDTLIPEQRDLFGAAA